MYFCKYAKSKEKVLFYPYSLLFLEYKLKIQSIGVSNGYLCCIFYLTVSSHLKVMGYIYLRRLCQEIWYITMCSTFPQFASCLQQMLPDRWRTPLHCSLIIYPVMWAFAIIMLMQSVKELSICIYIYIYTVFLLFKKSNAKIMWYTFSRCWNNNCWACR